MKSWTRLSLYVLQHDLFLLIFALIWLYLRFNYKQKICVKIYEQLHAGAGPASNLRREESTLRRGEYEIRMTSKMVKIINYSDE